MPSRTGTAAVILLAWMCWGCDREPAQPDTGAWTERADSSSTHDVMVAPSVCADCLSFLLVAVLGDEAGPGYLEGPGRVLRDQRGQYWVGQRGSLKVFDADGRFATEVGRLGEGPGEYRFPNPVYADSVSQVHVMDFQSPRLTILDAEQTVARTSLLPGLPRDATVLPMEQYVINASVPTPQAVGLLLHIVDGVDPEPIESFGMPHDAAPYSLQGLESWRVLTSRPDGRIITSSMTTYVIEAWTSEGQRITGWQGPSLNDGDVPVGPLSPESPPDNRILGIHLDGTDRLWVLSSQRREDWHANLERRVGPDGQTRWEPAGQDIGSLFRGRIDVIDLNGNEIIAQTEQPQLLLGGLGDGLFFAETRSELGAPQVEVWEVGFTMSNR